MDPVVDPQNTSGDGGAWKTELPESLRSHEAFAPYNTKSDLWTGVAKLHDDHKASVQKTTDLEGKLKDAIPKLPDNATQEERDIYLMSLGRPEKAEEYELDGQDKNATEWTNWWKQELFKHGVSKDTAKGLSASFNGQIAKMVEAHNARIRLEIGEAQTKLKAEYGDKYDSNVELAKRMWTQYGDGDFDKAFNGETSANRYGVIRYLVNMAKKTGEDGSPPGTPTGKGSFNPNDLFPNSPKSPTGK